MDPPDVYPAPFIVDKTMGDLLTFALLVFAPLNYLFQTEWKYQTSVKSVKELVVLISVTLATAALFFSYLVTNPNHPVVYYLLVFAIGGPFVDLGTRTYPSTGSLCHVVSVSFFVLIDKLDILFFWSGLTILVLSIIGFVGSILGRKRGYIGTSTNTDETPLLDVGAW